LRVENFIKIIIKDVYNGYLEKEMFFFGKYLRVENFIKIIIKDVYNGYLEKEMFFFGKYSC